MTFPHRKRKIVKNVHSKVVGLFDSHNPFLWKNGNYPPLTKSVVTVNDDDYIVDCCLKKVAVKTKWDKNYGKNFSGKIIEWKLSNDAPFHYVHFCSSRPIWERKNPQTYNNRFTVLPRMAVHNCGPIQIIVKLWVDQLNFKLSVPKMRKLMQRTLKNQSFSLN